MAGTKRQRSPGVWELRVHLGRDPITGKRLDVSETFRGGERAAGKRLGTLVGRIDELRAERLAPAGPADMTVAELLDRWQRLRVTEWAPKTAHDHAVTVDRWINPLIGDVAVVDLRRPRIEEFYAEAARRGGRDGAPLSATSVRKIHTVLHAALEDAVSLELVAGNPATKARRPKVTKYDAQVPSLAQISAAIDAADPTMAVLIRLGIATGARRGELVALKWSDVADLEGAEPTLHIQRAATKLPGEPVQIKGTKTGATAVLAIDPGTVVALRAWRHRQVQENLELGRGRLRTDAWIFPESTVCSR